MKTRENEYTAGTEVRKRRRPECPLSAELGTARPYQPSCPQYASHNGPAYDRQSYLVSLIPVWPQEIADRSNEGSLHIIKLVRKALRSERIRGKAGHWTYDLNRHISLAWALKAEIADLRKLQRRNVPGKSLSTSPIINKGKKAPSYKK